MDEFWNGLRGNILNLISYKTAEIITRMELYKYRYILLLLLKITHPVLQLGHNKKKKRFYFFYLFYFYMRSDFTSDDSLGHDKSQESLSGFCAHVQCVKFRANQETTQKIHSCG